MFQRILRPLQHHIDLELKRCASQAMANAACWQAAAKVAKVAGGGEGGEGGLLSFALSHLSLFSFCQSAQSMNQTARRQTALIKETAKHSSVRQVLTARFCACLVLRDRPAFFCGSSAAVHTNHPSITIAEHKQIATTATQAHEGYTRCVCSGSS